MVKNKIYRNQLLGLVVFVILSINIVLGYNIDSLNIEITERKNVTVLSNGSIQEIESALFNTILLKRDNPEYKFEKSIEKISVLAVQNKSYTIRHKARITNLILKNFQLFNIPKEIESQNEDAVYENFSIQFENALVKYLELTGKSELN